MVHSHSLKNGRPLMNDKAVEILFIRCLASIPCLGMTNDKQRIRRIGMTLGYLELRRRNNQYFTWV